MEPSGVRTNRGLHRGMGVGHNSGVFGWDYFDSFAPSGM